MAAVAENLGTYLEDFEKLTGRLAAEPAWLTERRRRGMQRFSELGFPTTRHEEYKYTNLTPLAREAISLADPSPMVIPTREEFQAVAFEGIGGWQLVFVNGHYRADLSHLESLPDGLRVRSLAEVLSKDDAVLEGHLTRYADFEDHSLTALNTAFFQDGAVVEISDQAVVEQPIHLIFLSSPSEATTVSHPRVLILAGRNSEAAVIESYLGRGDQPYWTNAVTEIVAEENARLDFYKVQQEKPGAFHTAVIQALEERNSTVSTHSLSFGGALVRNDITVKLDDEGCHCDLNGLYAVSGRQHVDHHTLIDHAKPHCTSHQLYKGVLDGHSRGVFNGKIIVRADAQKTDAIQNNKNLLLSEDADVNTKPQLEIDANDVRCTHGATVGQIDKEAAFYMRSRGIGREEARSLLTYAFAADILERVKLEPIRDHFEAVLINWLTHDPEAEVPK